VRAQVNAGCVMHTAEQSPFMSHTATNLCSRSDAADVRRQPRTPPQQGKNDAERYVCAANSPAPCTGLSNLIAETAELARLDSWCANTAVCVSFRTGHAADTGRCNSRQTQWQTWPAADGGLQPSLLLHSDEKPSTTYVYWRTCYPTPCATTQQRTAPAGL